MKITEIISHPLALDYAKPLWTAHERFSRAQLILVEVRTDQGVTGFGEIASGALKTVCDLLAIFSAVVAGMDPLGHGDIWHKLMSLTSPRPGGIGGWDGLPGPLPRSQRPEMPHWSRTLQSSRASWSKDTERSSSRPARCPWRMK